MYWRNKWFLHTLVSCSKASWISSALCIALTALTHVENPVGLTRFIRSAFQFKVRSAYLASGSRHWLNKGNTPELALCEFHAYLCLPCSAVPQKKGLHLFQPYKKVERIDASKSFAWTKGQKYPGHLENIKLKAPRKRVMRRKQIDNPRRQTVARTPLLPRLSLGKWSEGKQ